jgi:hypothetical protein
MGMAGIMTPAVITFTSLPVSDAEKFKRLIFVAQCTLPYSQKPDIGHCTVPDQSNPQTFCSVT